MATVAPRRPFNRADTDRRVRHPLDAIRGYIRRYVLFEGLSFALLFVAAWFWIGLVLDYVPFLLFRFDWIKEVDHSAGETASFFVRLFLLVVLTGTLVGVVAFKVFRRLFREFSDRAVALVLERRFPKQLGDRLITAVEMADPNLAKKYGFSQEMLDQTIAEAADRVEKLPVHEVFSWGRLYFHMTLGALATVGLWLAVMVGGTIVQAASGRGANPIDFFWEFNHVAGTWAERNLLLQDRRYWLGNEYIELVRFPAGGELRVARDENRPDVWARSVKWVVSDRSPEAPEGWRGLRWKDLSKLLDAELLARANLPADWPHWVIDMDDLDPAVPAGVVPIDWAWQGKTSGQIRADLDRPVGDAKDRPAKGAPQTRREFLGSGRAAQVGALDAVNRLLDWREWTVDRIEQELNRKEVRAAMKESHPAAYQAFADTLTALADLADSPRMRGTLRQLEIPDSVFAHRRGKKMKGSSRCLRQENNKYAFNLNELTESVTFYISGKEYSTSPRQVTLVPPPAVVRLGVTKDEPAYIHFRLLPEIDPETREPVDQSARLKGLRQVFRDAPASTTGTKSIIPVPFGTSVTLTGATDRDLRDGVRLAEPLKRDEAGSLTPANEVKLHADRKTFSVEFGNVTRVIEFEFDFRDSDNVKGRRHVIIKPVDDKAPNIQGANLAVQLRSDYDPETAKGPAPKGGERLLITPNALVPFKGLVTDDRGLSRVVWKFKYQELPFQRIGEGSQGEDPPIVVGDPQAPPSVRRAGLVASLFQFMPGQGYEFFAPAYVGGLAYLTTDEAKRASKIPPAEGEVEADTARRRLNFRDPVNEVNFVEMRRLLQIQPRHRDLIVREKVLDLKTPKAREDFIAPLKEAGQDQAFLADLAHVLQMPAADRDAALKAGAANPAEGLGRLIDAANRDADGRATLLALLARQPEKLIIREHSLEQEPGFDVKAHLAKLRASPGETQRHYELQLSITAADNNIETGPGKATPRGPFTFLIVSENELIAEILRQEGRLYALLKDAVDGLDGRKISLEAEVIKLESPNPELGVSVVRVDQARKALREAADISKAVLDKYLVIQTEMLVNRFESDKPRHTKERIIDPLEEMTRKGDGDFAVIERTVNTLLRNIEDDINVLKKLPPGQPLDPKVAEKLDIRRLGHVTEAKQVVQQVDFVLGRLRTVLDAMKDIGDKDKAVALMVQIEAMRRANHQTIEAFRRRFMEDLEGLLLGPDPKEKKK